jgi:PIN domain nuclease of toxin-antitoxin system
VRFLLDTHTFIWIDDDPSRLSERATAVVQDKRNIILLSYASVWEMQIKAQLGKLTFSSPLRQKIQEQQQNNGLTLLPIELRHIFALDRLPAHHRDPFDRLLIAQANIEHLPIISHDPVFSHYPVRAVW